MKDLSNENIIHVKNNNIQYLQFKRLLQYQNKLKHCYTLKPLDFKNSTKDSDDYKKICKEININNENIVHPKQTHTKIVRIVNEDDESSNFDEVDGLITDKKNKALSLYFADCTALFLYDPIKNVIGDIHSGWRGTVQKIGMVAVHFQVEKDVKDLFMQAFNDESIIKVGKVVDGKQKYYIDAVKANINMMKICGLKEENIIDSGICTVCNSDILHSYRTEKQNAGRNAAIMCLI